MASNICSRVLGVFFEYDTPKIVHIRSKKVGVINRFLQLCIIGYVIGYAIIFKKGYQEFDNVRGAVTTKLKGVARTDNFTSGEDFRIWDVSDYVVPPQENGAFFVTTNYIVTDGQQIATCEEDLKIPGVNCTDDPNICVKGKAIMLGNGFMTGKCIESVRHPGNKACEIEAWCPTEDGFTKAPNPAALDIARDFTVFIKNNIEFPKFGVKRRNIPKSINNQTYLQNCRFDFGNNKLCPVFKLETIVGATGDNSDFENIAVQGGVIQIIINWDCNLDYNVEDCVPEYMFRRLDSADEVVSPGYNFRYSHYYRDINGTEKRTLFKAYGIKFILTVQGTGGKFNVMPLALNIGSGLAILSVATILCDIIVLYVLKAKNLYRQKKYLEVVSDDAYKDLKEETEPNDSSIH
ncbi:Receptor for ATP that acts as a ligand-gated ion channel [Mactra antiquata]